MTQCARTTLRSGVAVPIGCALRLYDRGGVLQADIHVSALERAPAGASPAGTPPPENSTTRVYPLDKKVGRVA